MTREEICARIPHGGSMCLLARAATWDGESIECYADSHRDPNNPLRSRGRLQAVNGVEYAAQAMALHGGMLSAAEGTAPGIGYLASVRELNLLVACLDDIPGELRVVAIRQDTSPEWLMYRFEVTDGARPLVTGRAMVKLMNQDGT